RRVAPGGAGVPRLPGRRPDAVRDEARRGALRGQDLDDHRGDVPRLPRRPLFPSQALADGPGRPPRERGPARRRPVLAGGAPAGPGLGCFLTLDFMAANLFLLFVALLPLRSRLEGAVKVASDGWQLCATPFFSRAGVAQEHALYFVLEGDECMLSKQYEQARQ